MLTYLMIDIELRIFIVSLYKIIKLKKGGLSMKSEKVVTHGSSFRIALSGCGGAGFNHAHAIAALSEWNLVAVCDVVKESATKLAKELVDVKIYTDYAEMLDTEQLDAVAIVTPPHIHAEQIEMAAEHGLHVLTEKPLAITVEECKKAVNACSKADVLLGVTFTYHFVPDFRRMREIADNGEIGTVREVRWLRYGGAPAQSQTSPPPPHPATHREAVVGSIIDCDIHAFDLMRWFAGSPIVNILAQGVSPGPGWEHTSKTVVFTYADGQRGVYDNGAMTAIPDFERGQPSLSFMVVGTEGSMIWDFKNGWTVPREKTRLTIHTANGSRIEHFPVYEKCRDLQYAEFARAIREGQLPSGWPTLEQAIEATEIAVTVQKLMVANTIWL